MSGNARVTLLMKLKHQTKIYVTPNGERFRIAAEKGARFTPGHTFVLAQLPKCEKTITVTVTELELSGFIIETLALAA